MRKNIDHHQQYRKYTRSRPVHKQPDDWDARQETQRACVAHGCTSPNGWTTGRIGVNVGSIAGIEVYPNGNVYCASKFAVDAFTQGLRLDLNPYGIRICAVHPGLVETEFSMVRFKGDEERSKKVYDTLTPLTAADVANAIAYMVDAPYLQWQMSPLQVTAPLDYRKK